MSTVLLNLEKLKGVEYHWRAHMMEDLQFNRDADKNEVVFCKCYRFAFSSPKMPEGGCAHLVARGEEDKRPLPAIMPEVSTETKLDQNSSADDVARWLKGLLEHHAEECAKIFTEKKITGWVLFNYLCEDTPEKLTKKFGLPEGCAVKILSGIDSLKAGAGD